MRIVHKCPDCGRSGVANTGKRMCVLCQRDLDRWEADHGDVTVGADDYVVENEWLPPKTAPLTAHDRCDRCGAQAFVRAVLVDQNLDLLFCAHHHKKHLGVLKHVSIISEDNRHLLGAKPAL